MNSPGGIEERDCGNSRSQFKKMEFPVEKTFFSGISNGKVTNLKISWGVEGLRKVYLQPSPLSVFSRIAHCY